MLEVKSKFLIFSLLIGIKLAQIKNINSVIVDGGIAWLFEIFIVIKSRPILLNNFRVLGDFPLPEPEQLAITKILAQNHDIYEDLGRICTRGAVARASA